MSVLAIIPARMGSTRFPGKVMADLLGAPMILHVVEAVKKAELVDKVMVATDDPIIHNTVLDNGGTSVMTRPEHETGTDRIAEAAAAQEGFDLVLNVQGDEPMISAGALDDLIRGFGTGEGFQMGTLARKIKDPEEIRNPNSVKVVFNRYGSALYFSRSPIPYRVDRLGPSYYKHVGVYLYRRDFLLKFPDLGTSALETSERLEQLRVLEAGYRIRIVKTNYQSVNVETPEDLARVQELMRMRDAAPGGAR